jgi:hypothetical protein
MTPSSPCPAQTRNYAPKRHGLTAKGSSESFRPCPEKPCPRHGDSHAGERPLTRLILSDYRAALFRSDR